LKKAERQRQASRQHAKTHNKIQHVNKLKH